MIAGLISLKDWLRHFILPVLAIALFSVLGPTSYGLEITPNYKTYEVGENVHIANQQGDAKQLIWSSKSQVKAATNLSWLAVLFEADASDFDHEMTLIFVDESGNEIEHSYSVKAISANKELTSPTIQGSSVEIYLGSRLHSNASEAEIRILKVIGDDEPLAPLQQAGGAEVFVYNSDWRPIEKIDDLNIYEMGASIVRITAPNVCSAAPARYTPPVSCTGFRVADNLFATSWHCVSEVDVNSCSSVELEFGYARTYQPKRRNGRLSGNPPTNTATENCEKIVYRNKNIDLAILQITVNNYEVWKNARILEFAGSPSGFPFDGEALRVLHYPNLQNCGGAEQEKLGDMFPVGLRVSGNPGPDLCRVVGYTPKNLFRYCDPENGEICNVSWPAYFPPNVKSACETSIGNGFENRFKVAFRHRCSTCGGSSGAPALSMHSSRKYKVIGVHQAGQGTNPDFVYNAAIRASSIADCIDVEKLTKGEIAPNSGEKGSEYWPYCRSDGAMQTSYLNCSEVNMVDLTKSQRKLCELELR